MRPVVLLSLMLVAAWPVAAADTPVCVGVSGPPYCVKAQIVPDDPKGSLEEFLDCVNQPSTGMTHPSYRIWSCLTGDAPEPVSTLTGCSLAHPQPRLVCD